MKTLQSYIKEAQNEFFKVLAERREHGQFVGSDSLYKEAVEKFGVGAKVISVGYSDYGGTLMDRALIEWYKEEEPEMIVWENTSYNGACAICVPVEDIQDEDFFYDVDGLEDVYYEIERQLQEESAKYFCDSEKCEDKYDEVLAWLEENGSDQATSIDYSWDDLKAAVGL